MKIIKNDYEYSINKILNEVFKLKDFRNGQREIINSVLSGYDTLAIMPTGGGKSLCFQLPALLLNGIAVIISPLISLMKDQNDILSKVGIPSTYLNSILTQDEYNKREKEILDGKYKILYISPERLENVKFRQLLKSINISFFVVDEAHCISHWGHDFRNSYLNISDAISELNIKYNILALTATATLEVQNDIISSLNLRNVKVFNTGFDRNNLDLYTEYTHDKEYKLIELLNSFKNKYASYSIIIYCSTRKIVEDVYSILRKEKYDVLKYHAGLTDSEREINQSIFNKENNKIMIATNAFGMGINKMNVRAIIHYNMPSSVEEYYQEIGRAGRDGKSSLCYMFYNELDIKIQEFFIKANNPSIDDFRKTFEYLRDNNRVFTIDYQKLVDEINLNNKNKYTISVILDEFEKNKIITRVNSPKPEQIKLLYKKKYLIDYLEKLNESEQIVLNAIIRTVADSNYQEFVNINTKSILQKYNISRELFNNVVCKLNKLGIIQYREKIPLGSFYFSYNVVDFEKCKIDFNRLNQQREIKIKKLREIIEYAKTKKCKNNYILNYFSSISYNKNCKHCCSCLNSIKHLDLNENRIEIILVLKVVSILNSKYGKTMIIDFLKGNKNNEKINRKELYLRDFFGILCTYTKQEIINFIDIAIEKQYIEKTEVDQYPILKLSDYGEQLLKKQNKLLCKVSKHKIPCLIATEKYNKISKYDLQEKEEWLKINKMFKSGYSIEQIANKLNISKGNIAKIVQKGIEYNGNEFNYKDFIDSNHYLEVENIIKLYPNLLLKDIQSRLTTPIDYALLKIAVAFVNYNIKNKTSTN